MLPARRRAAFQNAVRVGFEAKDRQQRRIRSFRNIVVAATLGLTVLVAAICLVGARDPDAIPLCFIPPSTTAPGATPPPIQGSAQLACPSGEAPPPPGTRPRRLPAPGDVSLVAFLGMLGAALSAAVALRKLQGISTPYTLPVVLALFKLPLGAFTAVVGLLLVHGGFIPGLSQLDSQAQILAYAFLFGIAQQLVTRLIDRQAQDILVSLPSTEPTSAKPEPPPTDQKAQTAG